MLDYHVHTEFSVDCKIPMAEQCEAAIAAGVTEIAFTDHVDHEPGDPGTGYWDGVRYFESIARCRESYGDKLTILSGVEVDFNERIEADISRFMDAWSFDFVIGSVHYGDDRQMIFQDYFENRSWDEVYLPYVERLKRAAATGWFNTLGHIDLPKRYAPKDKRDYEPLRFRAKLQELYGVLIENGVAFEINTSGLRQSPKTSMPGPVIVEWYAEAGGTLITTGTDSHAPQHVGTGLMQTYDMLQLCGIDSVATFRNRERAQVSIVDIQTPVAV